ncbi:RHS repeat-associated core domain-containing protein [Lentisphaerota bacterium WC36G]|nr:RHS repeat-associated core domain-containing protein [Lentisphaerae bacterium WC36]
MNNGSISDRFVWLGDNLLALEKDGVVFNYIADGNKNITQLIDMSSGSIANRYDYSPFGQLSKNTETVANVFKFSSEYAEKESGLVYYNYRYYNPTNGKWLSRDPVREHGGKNIYGFVANNSIDFVDVLGLAFTEEGKLCKSNNYRVSFDISEYLGKKARKIGIYALKLNISASFKNCCVICPNMKKGKKNSLNVSVSLIGELGSKEHDLWILKVRAGWYGRLSASGSIGKSYNSCKGSGADTGSVGFKAEVGLILEFIAELPKDIITLTAGARGGVSISGRLSASCSSAGCRYTVKTCIAANVRWWVQGKRSFGRKKSFNYFQEFSAVGCKNYTF